MWDFSSSSSSSNRLAVVLGVAAGARWFCCYLSVYNSPQYESMGFRLVVNRLIAIGYPEAIHEFEYDHTFPVRSVCSVHLCV